MNWSIRKKLFMALLVSLVCIVLIGFLQSKKIHTLIVEELGGSFAENHILWQKERLRGAIEKELSLSRAMASSGVIQEWALNETNPADRERGLQAIENFRKYLGSGSWFAVFDGTKNYYYSDGGKSMQETVPLKTLDASLPKDAWYFVTLNVDKGFTLNVDYDEAVGKTNLWINIVMKRNGRPIGIIGTGLDISKFIRDFVETRQDKVQSYILHDDGSVFVSKDKRSMNMAIIAKESRNRIKIFSLVPEQNRQDLKDAIHSTLQHPDQIATLKTVIDGRSSIVALTYIPSLRWVVMSAIDDTGIYEAKNILTSILALIVVAILVFILFGLLIDKLIITPVNELTAGADSLRNGDYSARFPAARTDEIGVLKETFNTMAEEIQSNVKLLEERVSERTEELAKSRDKISILLNRSGEGFLKFNSDFIVDEEYSSECVSIFNREIDGLRVDNLLFSDSPQLKESFIKIISGITVQPKMFLKEIMLDLLPGELQLKERYYRLRFLLGTDDDYILIMTDVTEQKNLSKAIAYNERCLSFVVEFVKEEATARELIDEFEHFCDRISGKTASEVVHNLHTFKGNFLQKGFINLPPVIHAQEEYFQQTAHGFTHTRSVDIPAMKKALGDDMAILEKYLGKENLDERNVKVRYDRLVEIAQAAEGIDPDLFRAVSSLFKVSLKTFLRQFEKTVRRVAEEEGKEVQYRLDCREDILIVFSDYSSILASLYHLITNAVAHGIEVPDVRASKGKPEKGTITVSADRNDDRILLSIRDDGKGIDLAAMADKVHGGEATVQSIFDDGVTSSRAVKLTSGRGAGMGSVRREVEKLNGEIRVTSAEDSGTTIHISIPVKE